MPYPKKLLNDYESVALDLHPHWWFFAQAIMALIASVAAGIAVRVFLEGDAETFLTWVAIVAIVVSAIWLAIQYLRWSTTNFVITSDRIIFREGVVAKKGLEIPLERVNNIHFEQSVFERLLGAGDIMIESGGEGGQQRFEDIRRPERVQNLIHSQMEVNESRMYQTQAGGAGGDIATQLEQLEGLLERGSLTRDEFEVQKRRLLDD